MSNRPYYGCNQSLIAAATSAFAQFVMVGGVFRYVNSIRRVPSTSKTERSVVFEQMGGFAIRVVLQNRTNFWEVRRIVLTGYRKDGSDAVFVVHNQGFVLSFAKEGEDPSKGFCSLPEHREDLRVYIYGD